MIVIGDFNVPDIKWEEHNFGVDFIPMIGSNININQQIADINQKMSASREIAHESTSTLMDNGYFQMCNFMNNWGNILDLVYTNMPGLIMVNTPDFMLLPECKSDPAHRSIMCTIEVSPEVHLVGHSDSHIYCFKKANYDKISERLGQIDFHLLFQVLLGCNDDVNAMMSIFYQIMNDIFENCITKSTLRMSNKVKWHDKRLSELRNRRNK